LTFLAGGINYSRKVAGEGLGLTHGTDVVRLNLVVNESRSTMGILWEVVQTGLMYGQKRKSDTIEDRVQALEDQLQLTQNTLRTLVRKIEEIHGLDIDGDGRVG
jgi:hypothetical protein